MAKNLDQIEKKKLSDFIEPSGASTDGSSSHQSSRSDSVKLGSVQSFDNSDPIGYLTAVIKPPKTFPLDGITFWKENGCKLDKTGYEDLRFAISNTRLGVIAALRQYIDEIKHERYASVPNQVDQFGCNLIDTSFEHLQAGLREKVFNSTDPWDHAIVMQIAGWWAWYLYINLGD